jgi:ParB family transcriptional regulator, chromosome partitioning protein
MLNIQHLPARELHSNPFNPNRVDSAMLDRLRTSLDRLGTFKPVIVRQLSDGSYQILGGYHRSLIAQERDEIVPVVNLGEIDDQRAKEIALADNSFYGSNDPLLLNDLLQSMDIDLGELSTFLPGHYEDIQIDLSASVDVDLDSLGLESEPEVLGTKMTPTHTTLRFRVSLEDAERITELVQTTIVEQGFDGGAQAENAGDALMFLLSEKL